MSKARVVILEVVSGHWSVTGASRYTYKISRQHTYRLLDRVHRPHSRCAASNPGATPDEVIVALAAIREQFSADGLDAGPVTLQGQATTS
ncbi:hypothetical protein MB901379_04725 [Mycobacterium basiliense]|uniref:Uncharacterized protein n=1 Tax=Mycobacterium basiliense TaxID=2094119 RepID=A0A447GKW4_9MYCO|nr:hypothetical protein [Mycobacterium basiliense]VDM91111.1 hypothetical protein MB901379_04725 [Mycobacterium basiliense]